MIRANTDLLEIIMGELEELGAEYTQASLPLERRIISRDIDHFEGHLRMVRAAVRVVALSEIGYPLPLSNADLLEIIMGDAA